MSESYFYNKVKKEKRFILHENIEHQFVSVSVEHPNTYKRQWNNFNGIFLCDKTVTLLKNKKARWDLDQQTNLINGFWIENDDLEKKLESVSLNSC